MIYACVYPEKFEGDKALKLMQVAHLSLSLSHNNTFCKICYSYYYKMMIAWCLEAYMYTDGNWVRFNVCS